MNEINFLENTMQVWVHLNAPEGRGWRAEIRRAKDISDIRYLPCFYLICNDYFFKDRHKRSWKNQNLDQFAMILGLLAHIRSASESGDGFAKKMSKKKKAGSGSLVSELRFRRLIQCERGDHLYRYMIRIIRILAQDNINIFELANSIYYWGDNIKKSWAFDYFGNMPQVR